MSLRQIAGQSKMATKNKLLSLIHHLIISVALILKGLDKFSHHKLLGGLIFCFGVIVLVYFVYVLLKQKESRTMHILIHLFEGLASLFTAYIFFEEGKKYLQYGFILAAIGFFISVYVYTVKHKKTKEMDS